eukprot:2543517-Rhodomonas_salina.1
MKRKATWMPAVNATAACVEEARRVNSHEESRARSQESRALRRSEESGGVKSQEEPRRSQEVRGVRETLPLGVKSQGRQSQESEPGARAQEAESGEVRESTPLAAT